MNWSALDISILGPAFLAGLMVVATHAPLGREVLRRGIIFLDLAVAQIAGLGVIFAYSLGWEAGGWQIQGIAFAAALSGAALLYYCERRWPDVLEAIIGTIFIMAASAGIILLSSSPQAGETLKELLVGQILWVSYEQLIPLALISSLILGLWFGLKRKRHPFLFYGLFAIAVTTSVQLVGVYLVFASLIIPALAVRAFKQRALFWAMLVGSAGYATGLAISALLDLPSGATIVWALALCGLLVASLRPQLAKS